MACWMIPPPRDTHTHASKHRYSLYFKSHLGKAKCDQTFEKLMQALSSQRFEGLRSRFLLSGAVRIEGVLSDFSSLSQNHSHRCTTVVTAEVTLYCTTSSPQDILFAAALKNSRPLLPARKVLAPSEILFMAFFSQARHLFPNTDGPCKAGVGGIRIRCRWNCSSRLKASAASRKNVFKHSSHILISVFKDCSAQAAHSFIPFHELSGFWVPTWPC